MTFNATFIPVRELEAAGFVEYDPVFPFDVKKRSVFVSNDIANLLNKLGADPVMFNWVEANRILATFSKGQLVSASLQGKRSEIEKLTDMDEVWACCVRKPKPGWRLFGRFVAQDCLVLVAAHARQDLGRKSNYHAVAEALIAEWNRILPELPPYRASELSGYLSGVIQNVDEV